MSRRVLHNATAVCCWSTPVPASGRCVWRSPPGGWRCDVLSGALLPPWGLDTFAYLLSRWRSMLEKVSVSRGLSGYSFFLLFCKRICSLPIKAEHSWKDLTIIYFFYLHTARISHVFLHHRKEIHFTIPHALKAHHDLSHNLRLATYHSIEQFHSIRLNFSDHHVAERAIRRRELEL